MERNKRSEIDGTLALNAEQSSHARHPSQSSRRNVCYCTIMFSPPSQTPHDSSADSSTVDKKEEHDVDSAPKDVFDNSPSHLVGVALARLQAAGVELIEWRAMLYRRMSVPVIVRVNILRDSSYAALIDQHVLYMKDFSYVVPDEDLARASDILSSIGLPVSPHWDLLCKVEGEIHTKGTRYRLTRSSSLGNVQDLVLFPASFVSFNPEELYTATSMHLGSSLSTINILVPKPSAVYGWILRTMRKYPKHCRVRTILSSDLSELVCYHLLDVQEGYAHPEHTQELWESLRMDQRVASACEVVSQWTRNHEWRDGEEEFGQVLEGVIAETIAIEDLPGSTP